MLSGWENTEIKVDDDPVAPQSNLVFDVYTVISLGEGTTTVDFYNKKIYKPECSDGIDNDGDGLTDEEDPGCWADPTDETTYDPTDGDEYHPYCGDGTCDDGDGECCETCSDDCGECYTPPTTDPKTTGGGSSPLPYAKFQTPSVCIVIVTDDGVEITTESIANMETYDHSLHCNQDGHPDFIEREDDSSAGYEYFSSMYNKYPFGAREFSLTLNIPGPVDDDGSYDCLVIMDEHYTGRKEVREKVVCPVEQSVVPVEVPEVSQTTPPEIVEQTCERWLTDYILPETWSEWINDPELVKKLIYFFNVDLKGKYGTFDDSDGSVDMDYTTKSRLFRAVIEFQEDESSFILKVWHLIKGTGNVYISTVNRINEIHCNVDIPFSHTEDIYINDINKTGKNNHKSKGTDEIPQAPMPK